MFLYFLFNYLSYAYEQYLLSKHLRIYVYMLQSKYIGHCSTMPNFNGQCGKLHSICIEQNYKNTLGNVDNT